MTRLKLPELGLRKSLIASVEAIVGKGGYSLSDRERLGYCRDANFRAAIDAHYSHFENFPAIVIWPETALQISQLIKLAARFGVPVTPYGGGSGVCGGAVPETGGILMDLKRMKRLIRVDERRLFAEAEGGIYGLELEKELQRKGFTLGHFPSSILVATLGGYLAARSAGQCSNKYGKIEDMVIDLEFVDGNGEIHRTSEPYRGRGLDLTQAVVGNEGTFGIVTRVRLRIHPAPQERVFRAFRFPKFEYGVEALRRIAQSGIKPDVLRLYDEIDSLIMFAKSGKSAATDGLAELIPDALKTAGRKLKAGALSMAFRAHRAVNALGKWSGAGNLLVVVLEGHPKIVSRQMEIITAIAVSLSADDEGELPARRWFDHRYDVAFKASKLFLEGAFTDTMEVAATWTNLPGLYEGVIKACTPLALVMAHVSHVYNDGAAIYFTFVSPLNGRERGLKAYDKLWAAALTATQRHKGTISHHHGIGRLKAAFIRREWGEAVKLYDKLKEFFDPHGVLNPGVLLPKEQTESAAEAV